MEGPGGHAAEGNKPVGERQVTYDVTHMRNLMDKIENRLTAVGGGGGLGGWMKKLSVQLSSPPKKTQPLSASDNSMGIRRGEGLGGGG